MLFSRAFAGVLSLFLIGAAHSADMLETVKSKKEIVIGTEAQFAPFEYLQDGKIVGYGPDLMRLILADLPDVKVKQFDVPFQGILPGLATKRFDFVVTSVTLTKERADKFAFTVPIADATTALVKRKDDAALTDPAGIAGKTVGSQAGSAQLRALQEYAKKLQAEGKPAVTIREYVSFDEAYADLAAGRLAAVAQSLSNLATLVKTRGDVYAVIPAPIGPKTYFGWVGRKDADSAPLVKFFSDGIARAQKSGQLKALQMKWFGFTMDVPTDAVPVPQM
ncbi:amino acid ABC transporter substrate-binding protein (PAAT family) [Variovorax beijingensis]|uniref:Amino acid ABC transporter substrate-binding protein (PAAT family) n=1 Tax=Variovorax beijingensis TaxID=2496117 RepID=A0A561CIA6_9BURK|nr:transporter substrate-binding domain-containing protein [Variovorax beijingensis]TWD90876.1 amino acid ABC transporter substrate-binding protein (PAAT family) [Variovorax beijingensis]